MITISLDEFGDFEGVEGKNQPVFIAGVIFDDKGITGEEKWERTRIEAYYRSVIKEAGEIEAGVSYPRSLHVENDSHDKKVAAVKKCVGNTLSEFLQKGTFRGKSLARQERKGTYHIFVLLKSDAGMKNLLREKTNFLVKEDFGSNLYFNMVSQIVPRMLFHNPRIGMIQEVSFNIATRASKQLEPSSQRAKDYKKLGYRPEESKRKNNQNKGKKQEEENKVYFRLTNADTYRSVIVQEMIHSNKSSVQVKDFKVVSINYMENAWNQEFLYLADSICSVLSYKLKGKNAEEWLQEIVLRVEDLTGTNEDLIFGYDEADMFYERAWKKYEEGDYYNVLSIAYDGIQLEGAFADYYKKVWFPNLEQKMIAESNASDFTMAVRRFHETLTSNTLNQEKAMYILEKLEKMVPIVETKFRNPESQSILYYLYDAAVSAYCHIGDSKCAEAYFEKCTEYVDRVGVQEFIGTRNKMVVFNCDNMDFERAMEIADSNLMYQNFFEDIRKEMPELQKKEMSSVSLGKTYSQQAQVHAFLRQEDAGEIFMQALEAFQKGSADYFITESYLLHHCIDCRKKELFEKYAMEYFGEKESWSNRLKYLISEGFKTDPLFNFKYALYVYIKALYVLYPQQITNELWNKLSDIEAYVEKIAKKEAYQLLGHPAELIYKYLYLIALDKNDEEAIKSYQKAGDECLAYKGDTEEAILLFNEAECANVRKDYDLRDEKTLMLCTFLKEHFEVCRDWEISQDGETRYQKLESLITYMYR